MTTPRALSSLVLLLLVPAVGLSQSIPIKTVPVSEGHQFRLFPSARAGMGGASLALADPLLDPFANPALGAAGGFRFSSTPVLYGFSGDRVADQSGRTLPVGVVGSRDGFFGGGSVAWQELLSAGPTDETTAGENLYASAFGGVEVPGTGWAVGIGVQGARLEALDGVRLLYLNGAQTVMDGGLGLYRVGVAHHGPSGQVTDLTFLHHRFSMTHRIPAVFGWWDVPATDEAPADRIEEDETLGWAVQLGHRRPVGEGLHVGAQVTADWKRHPKIPNYDIMQIPRDPGHSEAYRVGLGFARTSGPATFAVDLFYEPVWSHTWADALEATPTAGGGTIAAGAMTVENFFRFSNAALRMGAEHAGDPLELQLGLAVHRIRYTLDQEDFVAEATRFARERWAEWTLSAGVGYRFPEFQVRYLGLLALGTGQPTTQPVGGGDCAQCDFALQAGFASRDFLVAANGPLSVIPAPVLTHQLALVLPLGPGRE